MASPHETAATSSPGDGSFRQDIIHTDKLFKDARSDDLIIVVMGQTGAGKSTFINRYCGQENLMLVNPGLGSCTEHLEVASIMLPSTHPLLPGRRLLLVDTPGFDDTKQCELDTLRKVSTWLADVYESKDMKVKVTGIVYLHSISQPRMTGSGVLSYELFCSICGENAFDRVVMVSTQWETVQYKPYPGPRREQDLQMFWKDTLAKGATYKRVDIEDPEADTKAIIEYILKKHAVTTKIQWELVELGKRVAQTEAGQKLKVYLEKMLGDPKIQELSQDKEEQLKELIPATDLSIWDWVKRMFRLKSGDISPVPPCAPAPNESLSKVHDLS